MQFFATIRKQSRYHKQQQNDAKGKPIPFPVTMDFSDDPCWPVKGGIGGQYMLYDVELFVDQGGKLKPLPIHSI